MLGFLAKVSAVVAAGIPVFAAMIGLVATGASLWGTYKAAISITVGLLSIIASTFAYGIDAAREVQTDFMVHLLYLFDASGLLKVVGVSVAAMGGLLVALVGIFSTVLVAAGAVWLYRKARFFANIATGTGVTE